MHPQPSSTPKPNFLKREQGGRERERVTLSASPASSTPYSRIPSTTQNCPFSKPSWVSSVAAIPPLSREHHHHYHLCSSNSKVMPTRLISFRWNSSIGPGGSGPGDGDRSVLDAFFSGKALAEALNECIESTVGEFLSTIGRLQAEQQKQVQDFQEVLERAKRAKEMAAREAMEAQGAVPKPSTPDVSAVINGDATTNLSSATDAATLVMSPSSYSSSTPNIDANADSDPIDNDPLLGVANEE